MFPLEIPSLCERVGDDVALLAQGCLEEMNQAGGTRMRFAPGSPRLPKQHPGPGNVGEPGNHLHRVFIMAG